MYAAREMCYTGRMDEIVRPLFWDTDNRIIDRERHAPYIIERVLEHGNDAQAAWLFKNYPADTIRRVAETSRQLSPRSQNYWRMRLNLWKAQPLTPRRSAIWKY